MSRDDGFPIADIDTGYFSDDRINALWRRLGDESMMCRALAIHQAVVLGSWGSGRRRTVAETLPLWLEADVDLIEHLVAVGMLDRSQRVPAKSWARHFGPAAARRELRREAGARGGKAPRKQSASNAQASLQRGSGSNAQAMLNPSGRQAGPSSPSVPTSPSSPRGARAQSANGRPEKLGNLLPPFETLVASGKGTA